MGFGKVPLLGSSDDLKRTPAQKENMIPEPSSSRVFIDFDGTISCADVLDKLIERFAVDDSWKGVESRWQAGLIGSRECLSEQFAVLRVWPEDLDQLLLEISLDPGVESLFALFEGFQVPVAILSDGLDGVIRRLLAPVGLDTTPLRSNTLRHRGDRIELRCPHSESLCESAAAHCKCASMQELNRSGRKTIYIGDGRSDLCPARKADVVFAKNILADCLTEEKIPYIPYGTLGDVRDRLAAVWEPGRDENRLTACQEGER